MKTFIKVGVFYFILNFPAGLQSWPVSSQH